MTTGSPVLQSGFVTPNHIPTWNTDGVIQDGGFLLSQLQGTLVTYNSSVNFNSPNTDNNLFVPLPVGFTRYRIAMILISGASAAINNATCGVFTQTGAGGIAVVAGSTPVTIITPNADTNNNMQQLTIVNQMTMALSDGVLYFRVQTAQGSAALATVSIFYHPLP